MTQEQRNFITMIGEATLKHYPTYLILPSLTIAQAILESNWGKSGLSRECFNYFGMKYREGCGTDFKEYATKEQKPDGTVYTILAKFRKWSSAEDGIRGYYQFLHSYKRYANLIGVTDPDQATLLIRSDGWATSLTYTQKLRSLIDRYDLTAWDEKSGVGAFTHNGRLYHELRKGNKGDEVKAYQHDLNVYGSAGNLVEDGIFGELTKQATIVFQALEGLDKSGIANVATRKRLFYQNERFSQ